MTTIAELFNLATTGSTQTPVEKLEKAVDRLETQLAQAHADEEAAGDAHRATLLANVLEDTPADDKAVAKLKAAADAARDRAGTLLGTLAMARARLSAAQATASRDEHRGRWAGAVGVSASRLDAMKRLDKSLTAFAADFRAAVEINGHLVAALPANPDPDAVMTRADLFEAAMRRELVRLGCAWAAKLVQPACDLPPMLPQFEGAHELVKRWAPEA